MGMEISTSGTGGFSGTPQAPGMSTPPRDEMSNAETQAEASHQKARDTLLELADSGDTDQIKLEAAKVLLGIGVSPRD